MIDVNAGFADGPFDATADHDAEQAMVAVTWYQTFCDEQYQVVEVESVDDAGQSFAFLGHKVSDHNKVVGHACS